MFAQFAYVPTLEKKETVWKVKTAFAGASVGDILFKLDYESFLPDQNGDTQIKPYYTYYWNVMTRQELALNEVNLNNLEFVSDVASGMASISNVTLNTEAIPIQTGTQKKTYSNVKSAVIYSQPLILGATLNLSSVSVNGVAYSVTSPVQIPILPNSKMTNDLVISNNNIAISIMYTT